MKGVWLLWQWGITMWILTQIFSEEKDAIKARDRIILNGAHDNTNTPRIEFRIVY